MSGGGFAGRTGGSGPRGRGTGSGRRGSGTGSGPAPVRTVIWLAFMAAVLMYAVVGWALGGKTAVEAEIPGWLFPLVAAAIGVAALLAPGFLRRQPPPGSAPRPPEAPAPPAAVAPAELIAWAFDEAVAVVGLVSVLVGGSRGAFAFYLLAAWVLLWLHRPTAGRGR